MEEDKKIINFLENDSEFEKLLKSIKDKEKTFIFKTTEEGQLHLLSYLISKLERDAIIISLSDTLRKKEILRNFINLYDNKFSVSYIPSLYPSPWKPKSPPLYLLKERMASLYSIFEKSKNIVFVDLNTLFFPLPPLEALSQYFFTLHTGEMIEREELEKLLHKFGYDERETVSQHGDFTVRGSIVDVFPLFSESPVRIEFEGDEIYSIREFSVETQLSTGKINKVTISSMNEKLIDEEKKALIENEDKFFHKKHIKHFFSFIKSEWIKGNYVEGEENLRLILKNYEPIESLLNNPITILLDEEEAFKKLSFHKERMYEDWDKYKDTGVFPDINDLKFKELENFIENSLIKFSEKSESLFFPYDKLRFESVAEISKRSPEKFVVFTKRESLRKKLLTLKEEDSLENLYIFDGTISRGFFFGRERINFLSERSILGENSYVEKKRKLFTKREFSLSPGDYVVHRDYGIGLFKGTKIIEIEGVPNEFLEIEYYGGDKIFIPVSSLELLYKYSYTEGYKPKLDKLGTKRWEARKKKIKEEILEYAKKLIETYAKRKSSEKIPSNREPFLENEFYSLFEYELTEDQKRSWEEIKKDMESPYPMDRLLCGDVGFGKTELAVRAAFKAVISGKQVAFVSPTTILVEQHYRTFKKRFFDFPVEIRKLSRFTVKKEKEKILKEIEEGKADIVIGTHSLLRKNISFKNLGLIIIDEEQRFGVFEKEKLLEGRENVDLLLLSATPIPRTLNMALSGLRDLSIIETPPPGRLDVATYVERINDETIKRAVEFEISRGGQVYIVYNKIEKLHQFKEYIERLVPDVKTVILHSKMKPSLIEKNMFLFISGEYDILLSTTIIENGIDIPNVNTLIVVEAENFGLSQLYQLRGRVGRSTRKAYAYFLIGDESQMSDKAKKRLRAIKEFSYLGSGFRLAQEDLEIRGAGNLIGKEQHGHIEALGFDYYVSVLERAIRELKGESKEEFEPKINLPLRLTISKEYIPYPSQRIYVYKRFSDVKSIGELERLSYEIEDRYGKPEESIKNLELVSKIKIFMRKHGILKLEYMNGYIVFELSPIFKVDSKKIVELLRKLKGEIINEWSFRFKVKKEKIKNFVFKFFDELEN